jgi:BCD family chlorophyll transporter-like MFS transporter
MILVSLVLLGFTTIAVKETGSALAWVGMVAAVILFSIGSAFSGTTFLALIYDRTPPPQRTRAVSVVWFFLISGFALSGVFYSVVLPTYTREGFLALFIGAPLIMGALWFFSILGEERRQKRDATGALPAPDSTVERRPTRQEFWDSIKSAWTNRQTRLFFAFLGLTTLFFYTQDGILEPFAGEVFKMDARITNRFSSYWGTTTLIAIVVCLFAARRWPKAINNRSLSFWSVLVLAATFLLFTISAFGQVRGLVTVGLVVLGVGLGMWTVGTLGLMMDMTRIAGAGLYLSLWTLSETLARGLGTLAGGSIRDFVLMLTSSLPGSYGAVFIFQTGGFAATLLILRRISVQEFQAQGSPAPALVLEASMD